MSIYRLLITTFSHYIVYLFIDFWLQLLVIILYVYLSTSDYNFKSLYCMSIYRLFWLPLLVIVLYVYL